jgi:hypothetical protein
MGKRMTWGEICRSDDLRGRWVALDACRYDQRNGTHPVEAEVVDSDEDLRELCNRMRRTDRSHCAIVFCDETSPDETRIPPRHVEAARSLRN